MLLKVSKLTDLLHYHQSDTTMGVLAPSSGDKCVWKVNLCGPPLAFSSDSDKSDWKTK